MLITPRIHPALAAGLVLAASALGQVNSLPTGMTVVPFYDTEKAGLSFAKDKQSVVGMWEVPGKPQHFLVLGFFGFVWSLSPDETKTYQPGQMKDYTKTQVGNFNNMVMKGWEQGALGGAFDPDFKENRFFYIIYNKYAHPSSYRTGTTPATQDGYKNAGLVAIERWKLSADLKALTRDTTILSMSHGTGFGSSNMVFGKDGMLYITTDSYSKNSWDSTDFMRKFLRIDVSKQDPGKLYAVPTDNPFFNAKNPAVKKEIYAFGFRNTYSIAANYLTGSVLGAEVGQSTWEEVNIIKPGRNYGWADGGDYEVPFQGVGIEGPCNVNTAAGQAFQGSLKNPYSYTGTASQGRAYTCADFTNGTWNFHHKGVDLGGSKTAVAGLDMNCIIMSPAFRGDQASPFHGYHFVTDVARNYFVAIREDQPGAAKRVGGLPSTFVFEGDKNHNGITSFGEDSFGNMYVTMLSSSMSGAFAYHDIYRLSHPQLTPLKEPRDVFPVSTHVERRSARNIHPLIYHLNGANWVRLPKGFSRAELYTLEGKRFGSVNGTPGGNVQLPSGITASALWTRFLP
jgi:hypothetical protein